MNNIMGIIANRFAFHKIWTQSWLKMADKVFLIFSWSRTPDCIFNLEFNHFLIESLKMKCQIKSNLQTLNLFIFIITIDEIYTQIQINMYKYLFIVLFVASINADASNYFLSPALPPTAFQNEFYTTQFRVIGLDNPVFSFANLPACFKGTSDGVVAGTPDRIGSYSVVVSYKSNGVSAKNNIVFRIAASISSTQAIPTQAGITSLQQFIVVSPNSSLTYKAGASISLSLSAKNGKSPYTWTYDKLPSGLTGDKNGKLSGTFSQQGYYSFSASACDSQGKSADSYYTINIQPTNVASSSNLIQVPNRNVPLVYSLETVQQQQLAATNAVYAAIGVVDDQQKAAAASRAAFAKTTLALQFAQAQENAANSKYTDALNNQNKASGGISNITQILSNAEKVVQLSKTVLANANAGTRAAQKNLDQAQNGLNNASAALKAANQNFINGQTESSVAAQNTLAALTANVNARNVFNLTFNAFTKAKNALQAAQDLKSRANGIVANAQNAVNLVNQANDNAQADLTTAQNAYVRDHSALNNANNLVSNIKGKLNDAQTQLGVSKFNLQQALNNLLVAQAAKAEADKATAVVLAQSSTLPSGNSTYLFAGCVQQAYPTICGTAQVTKANSFGYSLSTGENLLFGSCTTKSEAFKVGDYINYNGYIQGGFVQATSISACK